jgi:hypothetical protein
VTDLAGNALDGEIGAAYPSGNNSAGGDLSLRLDVLPGDADLSRAVNMLDFHAIRQAAFNSSASAAYNPRRDLDGNGAINVLDLHADLLRQGATLPTGNPPGSPEPPSAPLAVIAEVREWEGESVRAHGIRAATRALSPADVDQVFSESVNQGRGLTVLRASRRARVTPTRSQTATSSHKK